MTYCTCGHKKSKHNKGVSTECNTCPCKRFEMKSRGEMLPPKWIKTKRGRPKVYKKSQVTSELTGETLEISMCSTDWLKFHSWITGIEKSLGKSL